MYIMGKRIRTDEISFLFFNLKNIKIVIINKRIERIILGNIMRDMRYVNINIVNLWIYFSKLRQNWNVTWDNVIFQTDKLLNC